MKATPFVPAFARRLAICGWLIAPCLVHGQTSPEFSDHGLDADTRMQRLGEDLRESFESTLRFYDEESRQRPYDVIVRRQKCEFIDQFTYTYEYVDWVDDAYALSDECVDRLDGDFPEHPEVRLLELERLYGEDLLATGSELDARSPFVGWTEGQLARLYTLLATTADAQGNPNAGAFALRALELDDSADVRLIAASDLVTAGDLEGAKTLLTSPMARDDFDDPWQIARKMGLLAQVGERERVLSTYEALQQADVYYSHYEVARALRDAGAIESARSEFEQAVETDTYTTDDERGRFEFEYEFGTGLQALDAYSDWRATGWLADPVGINRMSVFFKDPSLPWRLRDLSSLLGAIGAIGSIGLLALLPLTIPHYRGLARRAKHGQPYPTEGWQLRHAWTGMFLFGLASLFATYAGGPVDITATTGSSWATPFANFDVARVTMVESFLAIAFLMPLSRTAAIRQPAWWGGRWSVSKSLMIGAGAALALRLPSLSMLLVPSESIQPFLQESELWQMIAQVRDVYGLGAVFWLVVVLAPVVEEFLFRGVLLGAISNHISFGWANAIQAAVFASLHMDAAALPYLFVMGLIAGVLARRSGGLLASMTFHFVFNLIISVLLLR